MTTGKIGLISSFVCLYALIFSFSLFQTENVRKSLALATLTCGFIGMILSAFVGFILIAEKLE